MQYVKITPTLDGGKIFFGGIVQPLITWRIVSSNTQYQYVEVSTPESTFVCYPVDTAKEVIVKESLSIITQFEQQLTIQLQEISF